MGVNRIDFVFQHGPVAQSELDRNVVKPAGRETAIEMPQARNDHPDDRHLDVRARLIEDEEIEAGVFGELDAGDHLLTRIEAAELRAEVRANRRTFAWYQIWMILQAQRSDAIETVFSRRCRRP